MTTPTPSELDWSEVRASLRFFRYEDPLLCRALNRLEGSSRLHLLKHLIRSGLFAERETLHGLFPDIFSPAAPIPVARGSGQAPIAGDIGATALNLDNFDPAAY